MERRTLLRGGIGFAAAGSLGGVASCARATPPYGADGVSFLGAAGISERNRQIKRAGAGLGWAMEDVDPRTIRGTLNVRSHQAVVDIPYDQQRFSLRYAGSTNLNYTGSTIHGNYNNWVQRLERQIVAQSSL